MLKIRIANKEDGLLYYEWANEKAVRRQSINSGVISMNDHLKWFNERISDSECEMLIFENENQVSTGQIRLQKKDDETYLIGISVDILERGKGLSYKMLEMASDYFFNLFPLKKIIAIIKQDNVPSIKSFKKAGYIYKAGKVVKGIKCNIYTKENINANS